MPDVRHSGDRVVVDGKFFRIGSEKFHVKGVTYGPFAPNVRGEHFASAEQTVQDFELIKRLGANLIRVYHVPLKWFLDLALSWELKVLVDLPWDKSICFLDSVESRETAREAVRKAARSCSRHPAFFALSVVNEVPADIVRWSGPDAIGEFIEELISVTKQVDPDCLCTFGNFPTTEFLQPDNIDFHCFNIYLQQQRAFDNYIARLQMMAEAKPLVVGEFGVDSIREGEGAKCEMLGWQIETSFRNGLAGTVIYSFTDDWFKDGAQIENWQFGLTRRDREPKPSYEIAQKRFSEAPYFPLPRTPSVSVVVASYNGARTLRTCLDSLQHLHYPDFEVILIDDGSTDETRAIAARYPAIRYIRHEKNAGLSAARNTGILAANGEVIAFTDSDCRADEDWLYYLIGDLLRGKFAGVGGPNLLPPEDSWIAAAVMASPGGPAHVMLTDRIAEHIPGCNMAFYKWALEEVGGFDPVFRKAGDDVDLCWRLQQRGYELGFSPSGFVWHYRRSTIKDYLKQQHGYGEAEALLIRKHPEYFNRMGGSIWRGRIYAPAKLGLMSRASIIYHGQFGSAPFQTVYSSQHISALMFATTIEYHALITVPLLVVGTVVRMLVPLGIASLLISLVVCIGSSLEADIPRQHRRPTSRWLVALLYLLQPIVRGWARYQGQLVLRPDPLSSKESLDSVSVKYQGVSLDELRYKNDVGLDRLKLLTHILEALDREGWPNKTDAGWNDFDIEIYGSRWSKLQLTTVSEGSGQYQFRCRLKPSWTFLAEISFWSAAGVELFVLGFLGRIYPKLWLLLVTLAIFAWWLEHQKRRLQKIIAVFLDDLAAELNLKKISSDSSG